MAYPETWFETGYGGGRFDTYEDALAFCNSLAGRVAGDCVRTIVVKKTGSDQASQLEKLAKILAVAIATIAFIILGFSIPWKTFFTIVFNVFKIIFGLVKSVVGVLKSILNAIHFSELLAIHRVIFSLSPAYRDLVNKVYAEISKVSDALGFAPEFISMALRNARAIVLSTSALVGRSYDMAELDWWTSFDSWAKKMSGTMERYRDHPELLFEDIDETLIRDAVAAGGEEQKGVLATVAATAQRAAQTVEDVKAVNDTVAQTVSELPSSVQKYVRPITDPIIERFDTFYFDAYSPTVKALGIEAERSAAEQERQRLEVSGMDLRMKKSSVHIGDWNELDQNERRRQRRFVRDESNAEYYEESDEFTAGTERTRLRREEEIKKAPKPPEPVSEPPDLSAILPPSIPAAPLKPPGWFVGDY